jgi:hypothetical protein
MSSDGIAEAPWRCGTATVPIVLSLVRRSSSETCRFFKVTPRFKSFTALIRTENDVAGYYLTLRYGTFASRVASRSTSVAGIGQAYRSSTLDEPRPIVSSLRQGLAARYTG